MFLLLLDTHVCACLRTNAQGAFLNVRMLACYCARVLLRVFICPSLLTRFCSPSLNDDQSEVKQKSSEVATRLSMAAILVAAVLSAAFYLFRRKSPRGGGGANGKGRLWVL